MVLYCQARFASPDGPGELDGGGDTAQPGGGNIFTSGPPEQQACLRDALGDAVFEAIASGERVPTEADNRAMNPCVGGEPDRGEPAPDNQIPGSASPPSDESPPPGGGGSLGSQPPEMQDCLRGALGDALFDAILSGSQAPTSAQNATMDEACGYGGPGPTARLPIGDFPLADSPPPPERNYPKESVSFSEARFIRMLELLRDDQYVADLLAGGFNTWGIQATYTVGDNGSIEWLNVSQLVEAISVARRAGLAVRLVPAHFEEMFKDSLPEENLAALYQNRLVAALELAGLAERLNVEYFTPIGEAEGQLDDGAFGPGLATDLDMSNSASILDPTLDPNLVNRVSLISEWLENMAPSLRDAFSGQLVAHFGTPHTGYRVPSCDIVGTTLDHYEIEDLDVFRSMTSAGLNSLVTSASASGIGWRVVETYFYWSEIADPYAQDDLNSIEAGDVAEWEDQELVARLRDLQDDYFRIALEEYGALSGGRGFDSGGWINPGVEIGGSPAEAVIREFFAGR
ncbi:MAG: hypothetical protein ISR43_00815 [Acidimicrobiia bacterium]|nr:hypothetical protein [Actinomycetota bacterium]MBL6923818.1 hypothetical protein [Acidimicrobiia bacterium]MBL6925757.1 hypothetical protein [Acidimicrobiia bacterium]